MSNTNKLFLTMLCILSTVSLYAQNNSLSNADKNNIAKLYPLIAEQSNLHFEVWDKVEDDIYGSDRDDDDRYDRHDDRKKSKKRHYSRLNRNGSLDRFVESAKDFYYSNKQELDSIGRYYADIWGNNHGPYHETYYDRYHYSYRTDRFFSSHRDYRAHINLDATLYMIEDIADYYSITLPSINNIINAKKYAKDTDTQLVSQLSDKTIEIIKLLQESYKATSNEEMKDNFTFIQFTFINQLYHISRVMEEINMSVPQEVLDFTDNNNSSLAAFDPKNKFNFLN